MTTPLVSICVPVYNVAPYIERCVRSVMEQTYDNLEYIFVDDCSTDNSIDLLQSVIDAYPERQAHIKILQNSRRRGTAYTRKKSIEQSHGEYIACVDADDSMPKNSIDVLLRKAISSDADVVCGVTKFFAMDGQTTEDTYTPSGKSYIEDFLLDYFPRQNWGKLYKRSLLIAATATDVTPEGMIYSEDRLLSLYICGLAKQMDFVQDIVYCYFIHANSSSSTRTKIQFENLMLFWQYAERYIHQLGLSDRYRDLIDADKISDKIHLLHFCKDVSLCRQYANIFDEAEKSNPKLELPRGKRLTRFLTKYHLWGLLWLYKRSYI